MVAKFIESDVYYKVTVKVDGEDEQTLYVTFGAQVDLAVFNRDGFTRVVKQNGKTIKSLIVKADTVIEISYEEKKTSSGGCMSTASGAGVALMGVCACGLLKRKRRETDEE